LVAQTARLETRRNMKHGLKLPRLLKLSASQPPYNAVDLGSSSDATIMPISPTKSVEFERCIRGWKSFSSHWKLLVRLEKIVPMPVHHESGCPNFAELYI
jgi:hypothetical protein